MQHSRLVTTLMMRQYTGQPVAAGVEEAEATVDRAQATTWHAGGVTARDDSDGRRVLPVGAQLPPAMVGVGRPEPHGAVGTRADAGRLTRARHGHASGEVISRDIVAARAASTRSMDVEIHVLQCGPRAALRDATALGCGDGSDGERGAAQKHGLCTAPTLTSRGCCAALVDPPSKRLCVPLELLSCRCADLGETVAVTTSGGFTPGSAAGLVRDVVVVGKLVPQAAGSCPTSGGALACSAAETGRHSFKLTMAGNQAVGALKGLGLGLLSGYALSFGLNLHLWTTVNKTLEVLRSTELQLTGGDKVVASLRNPFDEPPPVSMEAELQQLDDIRDQAAAVWNAQVRTIPMVVAQIRLPSLPDFSSDDTQSDTLSAPAAPEVSGGPVMMTTGGTGSESSK
eukprot:CAMPEP_0206293176 /NCGR_PEP_ID=MMETSP0106_2-20121207/4004_1 /ASSEMBLY_ACC=CAM_ASM_000206 /TAXON_ID=81532 /ORGANISM="Acanthoeca-like sp., Strain 10tr" /LENGTH=398 /DNA_ID=CAMNT_0053723767 /DNA_START=617 /DNA_END=1815 /DNA_ORIENTATION=-